MIERTMREAKEEILRGDQGPERKTELEAAIKWRDEARAKLFPEPSRSEVPCPKCSALLDPNGKCLNCGGR